MNALNRLLFCAALALSVLGSTGAADRRPPITAVGFGEGFHGAESARFDEGVPPASPEALRDFQSRRFGLFINWGPVSLTGRELGWARGDTVPAETYDKLYQRFNPVEFNADEWVRIARAAGMRYIVFDAKHLDGFCLWHTRQTDYSIQQTPFKRDAVRELADACRREKVPLGIYYCLTPLNPVSGPSHTQSHTMPESGAGARDQSGDDLRDWPPPHQAAQGQGGLVEDAARLSDVPSRILRWRDWRRRAPTNSLSCDFSGRRSGCNSYRAARVPGAARCVPWERGAAVPPRSAVAARLRIVAIDRPRQLRRGLAGPRGDRDLPRHQDCPARIFQ